MAFDNRVFAMYERPFDPSITITWIMKRLFEKAHVRQEEHKRGDKVYIWNVESVPYDDDLYCLWVMNFRNLFRHWFAGMTLTEDEGHDIIYDVFRKTMRGYDIRKLELSYSDRSIGAYVSMAIHNSIRDYTRLQYKGTTSGLKNKDDKYKPTVLNIVEYESLERLEDESLSMSYHDSVYDMQAELSKNPYGNRVLTALLRSGYHKVSLKNLGDYIELSQEERNNPQTLKYIIDAYSTIRKRIASYYGKEDVHNIPKKSFAIGKA